MNKIRHRSPLFASIGIVTAALLVIALISIVGPRVMAATQSGRLVTIHDRGEQKAFLSDAETVSQALDDAGIALDSHDAVEPALDQKLIAREYEINIYRARPVTVIDGSTRQKVMTPYQVADRIVKDTGITLNPEDRTTVTRTSNLVADGAGLQLTIDRATPLTLTLFGSKTDIRTQGETVGEMLKEKNIELDVNDRVSVAISTPITAGMEIKVWREGKHTVTVQEAVPFAIEQIRDADQYIGYQAIQAAGQDGQRNATYEIEIKDGVEVSRTEIASIVTTQPVKQVEIIGVKVKIMPYTGGGTKTEWLASSNIPEELWGYADFMVQKESGWNPNAINKSSGACGLAQALPCSKVAGNPYDPVNSLNWMNSYVNGRYGGWAGAYNFWLSHSWY